MGSDTGESRYTTDAVAYLCDLCEREQATVFWPEDEPRESQIGACQGCVDWMDENTVTITDPVQIVLSRHLAVNLDNYERLCLCGERFEAPGYHREHVAGLIYEALIQAREYAPLLWCRTHGKQVNTSSRGKCCTYARCDCRPSCDVRRLIIASSESGGPDA